LTFHRLVIGVDLMGRGKAKFPNPFKGKAVSVYLDGDTYAFLNYEVDRRSKRSKDSDVLIVPKDLTVPRLVAACVDYVIKENKIECLLPSFKRYQ
jgi:hypothetical protein